MSRKIVIEVRITDNLRFQEFERIFNETMPGAILPGLNKVAGEAIANAPVGVRGLFRSSIKPEIEQPKPVTVQGQVFSDAPYAAIIEGVDESGNDVEYGRRPGAAFPNIGELRKWVEKKIILEQQRAEFVGPKRTDLSIEQRIEQATIWIGRAIVRRGIKAKKPIGNAFKANAPFINRLIDEGVKEVFAQL